MFLALYAIFQRLSRFGTNTVLHSLCQLEYYKRTILYHFLCCLNVRSMGQGSLYNKMEIHHNISEIEQGLQPTSYFLVVCNHKILYLVFYNH